MIFINNKKGQGALEYLLIIGAALIVAITVIVLIISMSSSQRDLATQESDTLNKIFDETLYPPILNRVNCGEDAIFFTINSVYEQFYYFNNENNLVELPSPGEGNIYTLNYTNLPTDGDYSSLQVAAASGSSYSRLSTPALKCKN